MGDILQVEMALTALEVSVTKFRAPDATYNPLQVWLPMELVMHKAAICQVDDCAGACYFNSNKVLVSITIISSPHARADQTDWLVGQQGNNLIQGPAAVKINISDLCGLVVVPMRKPFAVALNLDYNKTLIVDETNTTFWDGAGALDTDFPGDGDLCMLAFPCTIFLGAGALCMVALPCVSPFWYGSVVPDLLENLLIALDAPDATESIMMGKPAAGISAAVRALIHNDYDTYLGKSKWHQ